MLRHWRLTHAASIDSSLAVLVEQGEDTSTFDLSAPPQRFRKNLQH